MELENIEMEFVDKNTLCLICLQDGEMRSVNTKDDLGVALSIKIMLCSNISMGSNFPNQICTVCESDLDAAYRFKRNAESSNEILKSLLKSKIQTTDDDSNLERTSNHHENSQSLIKEEEIFVTYKDNNIIVEQENEFNNKDNDEEIIWHSHNDDQETTEQIFIDMNKSHTKLRHKGEICAEPTKINKSFVKKSDNVRGKIKITTTNRNNSRPKKSAKPPKICEICGNSYKFQHALDSHMRRHRNEKPFSCEFCHRGFVANVELRRHMRVHTGQKPYSCHFCPRTFSDFGSRGKHERTHTGERPYACETCGKTFAYAHVLSVHVLTHTGEKKYKCCICEKGFTKKSYLVSHTANYHKGENNNLGSNELTTPITGIENKSSMTLSKLLVKKEETIILKHCLKK